MRKIIAAVFLALGLAAATGAAGTGAVSHHAAAPEGIYYHS